MKILIVQDYLRSGGTERQSVFMATAFAKAGHEITLLTFRPRGALELDAEQQPFADNSFDLITVSSGVHWFDIDKFLAEANRLLKSKSLLVLYENHFIAEMIGNDSFTNWFSNVYLKKFPSPPRNNDYSWTNENLSSKNFNFVKEERFKNSITLSKKQLALYFTTQSNVIAAVEKNQVTYGQVENWLDQELASFFDNDDATQTINYGNWIKFIQRAN